jgi:hypothetical protein
MIKTTTQADGSKAASTPTVLTQIAQMKLGLTLVKALTLT